MADAESTVPERLIPDLLRAADLQVPADRHSRIADQLSGLFDDANELSRKMAQRSDITPAVRFHHPESGAEEE